jgi:tRNA G10  N-methylase Trm11
VRVVADALALPLRPACVDVVVTNPPYEGNGVWPDDYHAGLDAAMDECRRVLRPGGRGFFLLGKRATSERWLVFDYARSWWTHEGRSQFPTDTSRPGVYWGVVPDADVLPLLAGTRPSAVVLDPFAGTGGIPKLATRLGHTSIGMDIDADQLQRGGRY